MKLQLLSDLHLDVGPYQFVQTDADYVILAGDINEGTLGVEWALANIPNYIPVIYICGNHEYWNHNMSQLDREIERITAGTHVMVLNNQNPVIESLEGFKARRIRFVGGTLWTDYNLYKNEPLAKVKCQQVMRDFRKIKYGSDDKRVTPDVFESCHYVLRDYIADKLRTLFDGPTVVVTHHAPCEQSIDINYRNDYSNPAYASNLEHLMHTEINPQFYYKAPELWVHGHIHASNDYVVGDTRVVSNPRGYIGYQTNPAFCHDLILEV